MDSDAMTPELTTARRDLVRNQLRTLLCFYLAAALVMLLVGIFTRDHKTTFLSALNITTLFGFGLLLRADKLQTTAFLACLVLLGTATYTTWTSRFGLLDSTTVIFAVVPVFCVLLLDRPLMLLMVALTMVDIFVIGFRNQLGLFVPEFAVEIIPSDPFVVTVVVGILALAVRRQQNHLWGALATSLNQERDLQRQAQQLQTSERRWRTLVHAAPEWIMQIDEEAVIRFTNRAERTGHTEDVGRPLGALVEPDEREAVTQAVREALAGHRPPPLDVSLALDGTTRHCVMNLGPLAGPDGVTGAIVLVSDETERRHLQLQLEQAQRLDSLGRLAGGIAHDFNNLLTVISGHTDLVSASDDLPADLAGDLEAISVACGRASALTGQILAFGRSQPQQAEPMQLNGTVESLVPMLGRLLGEGIALEVDLAPDLPPVVGDAAQVEQVVVNLVINARDAVRDADRGPGRTESSAATDRIIVRTRYLESGPDGDDWIDQPPPGPVVTLAVEDTGKGMDETVRRRAFEPFFTTKPKGAGTGLGLAMAYGIAKQHHGAIRVESAPDAGTTVTLALPARPDRPLATGEETDEPEIMSTGRGEHILLVEDDDAVRELTARMLKMFGYRVAECDGPAAALAAAARHTDLAAVVTDITMPGGSGLEMAEKLPQHLPVVFTSGYAAGATREAVDRIPEGRFLQKPFMPEDLARALRTLLDGKPAG